MSTEKIKTSRASQTREQTKRKAVWTPPSSLDAPPAPAGFHHRWIRAETMGFTDTKNIAGRLRSGYELVRADAVPRIGISSGDGRQIQRGNRSWWPIAGKDTRRDRQSAR